MQLSLASRYFLLLATKLIYSWIFICQCRAQIFSLYHIFREIITCPYAVTLSCTVLSRHECTLTHSSQRLVSDQSSKKRVLVM